MTDHDYQYDNDNPILLLHSSCRSAQQHGDGDGYSPSRAFHEDIDDDDDDDDEVRRKSSSAPSSPSHRQHKFLTQSPIICDMTILPEHPEEMTWVRSMAAAGTERTQGRANDGPSQRRSDNNDAPTPTPFLPMIRLPKNTINPCGVSNVIILEDDAWLKRGPVLVSLTSCHVLTDMPDVNDRTEEHERHLLLPIDLNPSTFSISFQRTEEKGASISEMSTTFSFDEAYRRLSSLHRRRQHQQEQELQLPLQASRMRSIVADEETTSFSLNNETNQNQHEQQRQSQQDLKASEYCTVDQEVLVRQFRNRWEDESQTLNTLLAVLAVAGVVLFGVLGWAIHQYHRSSQKAEYHAKEIQASMKKTREVIESTTKRITMQPLDLEPKLKKVTAEDNYYLPVRQVEVETMQSGPVTPQQRQHDDVRTWDARKESNPSSITYPSEEIESRQSFIRTGKKIPVIPSGLTPMTTERPHSFLRPHERRWFDQPSFSATLSSPTGTDAQKKHWDLSQLQQDWIANKAVRRSHRKGRRRQPLRPSTSPSCPPPTSTTTPTRTANTAQHHDDEDNSDLSSITQVEQQQKADLHSSVHLQSVPRISSPNNVRHDQVHKSTTSQFVSDDKHKMSGISSSAPAAVTKNWQPHAPGGSYSLSPIPPSVSETKGNTTCDDSSFIDDYW